MNVVTRFPPSPTGYLHIGRARTALFNYLFAQQKEGKMIFRLEDTDRERSKPEYEEDIIECLKWLGITYDEGPFRQSERNDLYKEYLKKMIDSGHAYVSKEEAVSPVAPATEGENGKQSDKERRAEVIRFKNPNKKVVFTDLIRGEIEFDTTDLKDFVIAKSLDEPLYHLAVVVDDLEMGVTHIIRGEDGISNTPRQILIQEAIGAPRPLYAHIPLILAKDRSKLSGRHGAVSVSEYRQKGYLPDAVINYIAMLGWHSSDDKEIMTLEDIIKEFSLERVQKSGAIFDVEKLDWYNKQYISELSDDDFALEAATFAPEWLTSGSEEFMRLVPVLRDKITVFSDISRLFGPEGELRFVPEAISYPRELLLWKKNPDPGIALRHLIAVEALLKELRKAAFTAEGIKTCVWAYAEANGKGDVLWPLRVALTGLEKSPDPFMSAFILGKEETLARIEKAIGLLK